MKTFIIHYYSKTLASIADRKEHQKYPLPAWRFDFPNANLTIALMDSIREDGGINLHTGLNLFVQIKADSETKALSIAKNHSEAVLNLVTLTTFAFCQSAKLVNVLEYNPDGTNTFKQYISFDESEIASLVMIRENEFRPFFEAFFKSSEQNRLMRSLSWLRKGLNEENSVDEFIAYWVGIEVLKGLLRDKARIWTKQSKPGEWDGVKYIFEQKLNCQNFEKINLARNELLHGFRELNDSFVQEINSYILLTRNTLVACTLEVLNLMDDANLRRALEKNIRRIRLEPWHVVGGVLRDMPLEFDKIVANFPSIKVKEIKRTYRIDDQGAISAKHKIVHQFVGPQQTKWELKFLEHWGDAVAGITRVDITDMQ